MQKMTSGLTFVAALLLAILFGFVSTLGFKQAAAATLFFVVLGLFVLPRRWLLPAALYTSALVPLDYGRFSALGTLIPFSLIFITVWSLRTPRRVRTPALLGLALVAVSGLTSAMSSMRPGHSVLYQAVVAATVLLPVLCVAEADEVAKLRRHWLWLSSLMALVAIAEQAMQHSLLEGWWSTGPFPLIQRWSVFRSTTFLGHPLINGVFFSCGAAVAMTYRRYDTNLKRGWVGIIVALNVAAAFSTASRSAALGLTLSTLCFVVAAQSRTDVAVWIRRPLAAITAIGLVYAAATTPLLLDARGQEGATSVGVRADVLSSAFDLFKQRPLMGWGPGNASFYHVLQGHLSGIAIESAALELLVGWGICGVLGLILVIGSPTNPHETGTSSTLIRWLPMLGIAVPALFFNMLEGHTKSLVWIGLALVLAKQDPVSVQPEGSPDEDRPSLAQLARRRS